MIASSSDSEDGFMESMHSPLESIRAMDLYREGYEIGQRVARREVTILSVGLISFRVIM